MLRLVEPYVTYGYVIRQLLECDVVYDPPLSVQRAKPEDCPRANL